MLGRAPEQDLPQHGPFREKSSFCVMLMEVYLFAAFQKAIGPIRSPFARGFHRRHEKLQMSNSPCCSSCAWSTEIWWASCKTGILIVEELVQDEHGHVHHHCVEVAVVAVQRTSVQQANYLTGLYTDCVLMVSLKYPASLQFLLYIVRRVFQKIFSVFETIPRASRRAGYPCASGRLSSNC